jgi:hypothetical protein
MMSAPLMPPASATPRPIQDGWPSTHAESRMAPRFGSTRHDSPICGLSCARCQLLGRGGQLAALQEPIISAKARSAAAAGMVSSARDFV